MAKKYSDSDIAQSDGNVRASRSLHEASKLTAISRVTLRRWRDGYPQKDTVRALQPVIEEQSITVAQKFEALAHAL